jgi:hypothetical protein
LVTALGGPSSFNCFANCNNAASRADSPSSRDSLVLITHAKSISIELLGKPFYYSFARTMSNDENQIQNMFQDGFEVKSPMKTAFSEDDLSF